MIRFAATEAIPANILDAIGHRRTLVEGGGGHFTVKTGDVTHENEGVAVVDKDVAGLRIVVGTDLVSDFAPEGTLFEIGKLSAGRTVTAVIIGVPAALAHENGDKTATVDTACANVATAGESAFNRFLIVGHHLDETGTLVVGPSEFFDGFLEGANVAGAVNTTDFLVGVKGFEGFFDAIPDDRILEVGMVVRERGVFMAEDALIIGKVLITEADAVIRGEPFDGRFKWDVGLGGDGGKKFGEIRPS